MSTELMERPVEVVNKSRIVHLQHMCDPKHGVCGVEILGVHTADEVNCFVCLDVWAHGRCPVCGGHI